MPDAHNVLFRTLADPTRRALFERLCREGEQTVGALTAQSGVSQPAVSKHLGVLRQAGLVRDRHEGRQTHYSAQPGALGAAGRLDQPDGRVLAEPVRRPRRPAEKDGPVTTPAPKPLRRRRTRAAASAGQDLARAHAAASDGGVADEERLQPVVGHRFNLRGDWGGVLDCEVLVVEPNKALSYTWNFAHADAAFDLNSVVTFTITPTGRDSAAHGAGWLPAGSEAGLWRRQRRMAAVLCEAGGGPGADGLISAALRIRASS